MNCGLITITHYEVEVLKLQCLIENRSLCYIFAIFNIFCHCDIVLLQFPVLCRTTLSRGTLQDIEKFATKQRV